MDKSKIKLYKLPTKLKLKLSLAMMPQLISPFMWTFVLLKNVPWIIDP